MENNGFDTVEMKETSKRTEAEGDISHYSEVNDPEQGTSRTPRLSSKPYAGMGKEELLQFSQTPGWRAARWICLIIILAGWCAMLGMAIYLIITTPRCLPWWQSAVVYQIFPKSFADSPADIENIGGDGVGDLRGIINKVDYLKDLGINAVMLSSIYKSDGFDNGEDIVDFTMVDDELGSIDDFEELLQVLHDNDIKLILDFIPNHSSVNHDFFQKSQKVVSEESEEDAKYQNYYTWTDAPENSNWISLYSGSAWECDYVEDKCFLHQYSNYTADFDLDNEDVKTHLTDALETWFTRGVDGFNIRGVKYFYEAQDLADEPTNTDYIPIGSDNTQYDSLIHDYTAEYAGKSHSLLQYWRDGVFYKFSTAGTYRLMLTDSDSNTSYVQSYYGTSSEDPEANLPMNFNLLNIGDPMGNGGEITGRELEDLIKEWLNEMDEDNWPNYQLGNYGSSRIASRLETRYSKVANILLLTLPGTPICYYGDEIGMENLPDLEFDQVKDLRALSDPSVWQQKTRDYERSPMQWDATMNAGFSSSEDSLYLPVHPDYQEVNVEAQEGDEDSILQMFRRLVALRSEYRALTTNTMQFIASSDEVIAYVREIDSEKQRFFIALNFGDIDSEVDYYNTGSSILLPLQGSVEIATEREREGSRVELNKLHLAPGEGMVVLLDEIVQVGSGWWYKFFTPNSA